MVGDAQEFVRNQIIVGFEENSTEEGIGIIEDKIGLKMIKSIDRLDLALFSYDDNRTIEEIVSRCLLLEFVEFAEINSIVSFEGYGGGDPQFSNQWYLKGNFGINWEKAMDVWVPQQNVPVAVVDTGVNWMHPDLQNQIYENLAEKAGYPGVDDDGNGKIDDIRGWDFIGDGNSPKDNNPEDYNGHGTFIAGLIAAEHDGAGMVGVCKTAKILPIRIGTATGTMFRSIEASEYAVSRGVKILNWSFGALRGSSLAEKRGISKFEAGWCFSNNCRGK